MKKILSTNEKIFVLAKQGDPIAFSTLFKPFSVVQYSRFSKNNKGQDEIFKEIFTLASSCYQALVKSKSIRTLDAFCGFCEKEYNLTTPVSSETNTEIIEYEESQKLSNYLRQKLHKEYSYIHNSQIALKKKRSKRKIQKIRLFLLFFLILSFTSAVYFFTLYWLQGQQISIQTIISTPKRKFHISFFPPEIDAFDQTSQKPIPQNISNNKPNKKNIDKNSTSKDLPNRFLGNNSFPMTPLSNQDTLSQKIISSSNSLLWKDSVPLLPLYTDSTIPYPSSPR